MFEHRILRGLMLAMALALLPTLALAERHSTPRGPGPQAVGHVTVNGNPLTIHVAVDTSIQVFYAGQSAGQVYPPGYNEADSGGFAWFAPVVLGPNFAGHDLSAANIVIPWLPGTQVKSGTGTTADPWWVQTNIPGPAGLTVTQWVRYIDGEDCFRVSYIISNQSAEPNHIIFFEAADLYVGGENKGLGYYDAATGAVGAWNQAGTFLEYMVPVTELGLPPASHYQEAAYQTIWNAISTGPHTPGPGFNDTIRATSYHDSACGLQWNLTFPGVQPPGNFVELALDWCFQEVEEPPPPEFVPEPGSVLLLAGGLMGLAGYAGLQIRKR